MFTPRVATEIYIYQVEHIPAFGPHASSWFAEYPYNPQFFGQRNAQTALIEAQAYMNQAPNVLAVRILRTKPLQQWQPWHYWTWNGANWVQVL